MTRRLTLAALIFSVACVVAIVAGGCSATPKALALQAGVVTRDAGVGLLGMAKYLNGQAPVQAVKYLSDTDCAQVVRVYNLAQAASKQLEAAIRTMSGAPNEPVPMRVSLAQTAYALYVEQMRAIVWPAVKRMQEANRG